MRRILRNVLIIAMLIAGCILLTGCSSNQTNDDVAEGGTKVLRVGMECAYAPYNWAQKDTSNGAVPIAGSTEYAYGYDVALADEQKFIDVLEIDCKDDELKNLAQLITNNK